MPFSTRSLLGECVGGATPTAAVCLTTHCQAGGDGSPGRHNACVCLHLLLRSFHSRGVLRAHTVVPAALPVVTSAAAVDSGAHLPP